MANQRVKSATSEVWPLWDAPWFFRQRILTQAASLEAKSLFNYLVSEIKARREVSLEEAILTPATRKTTWRKTSLTVLRAR